MRCNYAACTVRPVIIIQQARVSPISGGFSLLFFSFFLSLSLAVFSFYFLLGVALRKREGFSDLKREESRKQDMGDYGWSRNFDTSQDIVAVEDGGVLEYGWSMNFGTLEYPLQIQIPYNAPRSRYAPRGPPRTLL